MKSFDDYKWREDQLSCFNKWADFEGLDLRMSGEFEHSNHETHMAYHGFKAGQQSKQKEIDELNLTIKRLISSEEDIARSCSHWKESFFDLVISIRKAIKALEQTPYWDRSGNCEEAIEILKKTQE